jgi:hypothetical protein
VHRTGARTSALACQACGAALPPDAAWRCQHCGATLTAPGLAEAHRQVSALGPALQAHAEHPAPQVVQQRLAAQSAGLERQRERAAAMQAEADAHNGRGFDLGAPGESALDLAALRRLPRWTAWLLGALLVLLWWWF